MHANHPQPLSFPEDREHRDPRCLVCGYRLVGLDHAQCPECGQPFDPDRPSTYSRRRPFVWHQYWWPGAVLALVVGFLWAFILYRHNELGWGLFIGVPAMLGALMGYFPVKDKRPRAPRIATQGAVGLAAVVLIVMMMLGGLVGLFCAILLLGAFLPFAFMGYFSGFMLAKVLTAILVNSNFEQRDYLPMLQLLLLIALPGAFHLAQVAFAPPLGPVTVSTTQVLPMGVDDAWDAQMFYEDVPGPRPYLHRIGLPRPIETQGVVRNIGDQHISTYTKDARIVKQATIVVPGETLAFDLVKQTNFEDRALRFQQGRFDFEPIGRNATRVTLTSTYQPLMRPRLLWQPIERAMSRTLHNHILDGMAGMAPSPSEGEGRGEGGARYAQTTAKQAVGSTTPHPHPPPSPSKGEGAQAAAYTQAKPNPYPEGGQR
ncbi:MAG: hypothetical protein AAF085_05670 [Planctomycetota bacterium]